MRFCCLERVVFRSWKKNPIILRCSFVRRKSRIRIESPSRCKYKYRKASAFKALQKYFWISDRWRQVRAVAMKKDKEKRFVAQSLERKWTGSVEQNNDVPGVQDLSTLSTKKQETLSCKKKEGCGKSQKRDQALQGRLKAGRTEQKNNFAFRQITVIRPRGGWRARNLGNSFSFSQDK